MSRKMVVTINQTNRVEEEFAAAGGRHGTVMRATATNAHSTSPCALPPPKHAGQPQEITAIAGIRFCGIGRLENVTILHQGDDGPITGPHVISERLMRVLPETSCPRITLQDFLISSNGALTIDGDERTRVILHYARGDQELAVA